MSNVDKKSVEAELPVRLCNYTDVYYQRWLHQGLDYMYATATADQRHTFGLRVGDTVITKDSETADDIGVAALVTQTAPDFVCGYHLAILRPSPALEPRYLYWQVASRFVQEQLATRASGVTRFGLTYEAIRGVRLAVPPLGEQKRITDFLDQQVERIDEASAVSVQLAAQVTARTQAAMDDLYDGSGTAVPCKALLRGFPAYGVLMPVFVDDGVPFIRIKDLGGLAERDVHELPRITADQSREYRRTVVDAGDVLVGVVGSTDKAAVVPPLLAGANIARAVARMVPRADVPAAVLTGWTQTTAYRRQVRAVTDADTAQPTLNMGDLRNFAVPLPRRTLATLAEDVIRLQDLRARSRAETERLATLLEERKRALITACVTGEFDVSTASDRASQAALAGVPTRG